MQNFALLFCSLILVIGIIESILRMDTNENAIVKFDRFDNLSLVNIGDENEVKSYKKTNDLRYIPNLRIEEGVILFHPEFKKIYNISKKENTFRIAVLGDSVSYANGVEKNETYSFVLEKKLNEASSNIKFEVLNFAMPGYDLIQIRMLLEREIFDFNPDLIIYGFFFNDISTQDIIKIKGDRIEIIYSEKIIPYLIPLPFNKFFLKYFEVYRFLNIKLINILEKFQFKFDKKYYYLSYEEAYFNLNKIQSLINKRNIPLVIINFPLLNEDFSTIDFLENLNKKEGLDYFNIKEKLAIYNSKDIELESKTSYYNIKGHQIVGDFIFEYLMEKDFIPLNETIN